MSLPIIVSYYTPGEPYEPLARRLAVSCDRHDLEHHIVMRESRGSWEHNNAAKAEACLTAWHTLRQPILWVDADAFMHGKPELLRDATEDFGVHMWKGKYFAGGTLFFNQTPVAERLLEGWAERCKSEFETLDQVHLEREWRANGAERAIKTKWLPRSYCQIFDAKLENAEVAVIEHFQESRVQRKPQGVSA